MPACEKCGAHVGADGKWAPAEHLLRTSQERDTAVKAAVELRWSIGGMTGEIAKAKADCKEIFEALKLLRFRIDEAVVLIGQGSIELALAKLRGGA